MIKANELRIGNWIQGPLGEKVQVKVLGHLENPDYIFAGNETFGGQNGFLPIPLTPEILEKIKFADKEFGMGGYDESWEIKCDNNGIYLSVNEEYALDLTEIKYLHQLQNLYYSLTGEELPINPAINQ